MRQGGDETRPLGGRGTPQTTPRGAQDKEERETRVEMAKVNRGEGEEQEEWGDHGLHPGSKMNRDFWFGW